MKTYLYIPALVIFISVFSATTIRAQSGAAESVTGAPESDASLSRQTRPPVTYSTPDENSPKTPSTPQELSRQDFEDLYYQKEMWREYREDYDKNRPRPRNGPERK